MPNPQGALARAEARGVRGMVLAGVEPDDWRAQRRLVAAHPTSVLLQSYGLHPQWVAEVSEGAAQEALEVLKQELVRFRPAAIGEIGLDAHTPERRATLEHQAEVFAAQLRLARHLRLPVCLHILGAHGRALEILRQEGVPTEGGMVHSYSGSPELVRDYVDLGLHISFSGGITSPRAKRARQALVRVPEERLLLETDAPDQTPAPHRPGPNEPAFLASVLATAAELRGCAPEELAEATVRNAVALFAGAG